MTQLKRLKLLREIGLNSLLAVLVLMSIVLSARVWFPPDEIGSARTRAAQVQPTPPPLGDQMPDVFRPERIIMRHEPNRVALLPSGSEEYGRAWGLARELLNGLRPLAAPVLDQEPETAEIPAVTLVLPLVRSVEEWADQWKWDTIGLYNADVQIDRVQFRLGPSPGIHLAGPGPGTYRVGPLSPANEQRLRDLMNGTRPELFGKYRPLEAIDPAIKLSNGLLVPEAGSMFTAVVHARMPEFSAEEARYFPDLSVVRQITEQDARSFTDGQRLLRLAASGVLEYRTPESDGAGPDFDRASEWAREWVGSRGGWSQDLVLNWQAKLPDKTVLVYELRSSGSYPVETVGGAMRVEMTSDPDSGNTERITYFKRYPNLTILFDRTTRQIISPEAALQTALDTFPQLLLWEEVREMHLAYLARTVGEPAKGAWALEPSWVIQVGGDRIYMPAVPDSGSPPTLARPEM